MYIYIYIYNIFVYIHTYIHTFIYTLCISQIPNAGGPEEEVLLPPGHVSQPDATAEAAAKRAKGLSIKVQVIEVA